jgi:hypothetical protein
MGQLQRAIASGVPGANKPMVRTALTVMASSFIGHCSVTKTTVLRFSPQVFAIPRKGGFP